MKFLKEQIGRKSLSGVVFTITEIPVPLIREIVAEILGGNLPATAANVVSLTRTEPARMSEIPPRRQRGRGEGDAIQGRSDEASQDHHRQRRQGG